MKHLEEIIGKTLEGINIGNGFLDKTTKVQSTKAKINKWNFINQKSFCMVKETIIIVKRWEKDL